ncbi:hypothetical protein [Pseudomonas sp. CMR5c]|uniref:hypothetical protein n=1 Tax=Pseudomonas sp. CMR5c TaxID=658630 RepID=UPI000A67B596|nr:hypothetical protein [Pseudomonas sp. CMR5c]AZC16677.1 hypothetical protein C4K40_1265 [Pseudomonas sp. CMR5c]
MDGFEVFNQDGFKIAGSDYPNLVFYQKGTLYLSQYNMLGNGFGGVQYIGVAALPDDGATLRFYRSPVPIVENRGAIWGSSHGHTVEYFSFGPARSLSTQGLEVIDDNKDIRFSTSSPCLALAGVFIDGTGPNQSSYAIQTEFNKAGRKYAATLANGHCFYQLVRPLGRPYNASYEYQRMACLSQNGVYSSAMVGTLFWTHPWAKGRIEKYPNGGLPQRMLVADVTDL